MTLETLDLRRRIAEISRQDRDVQSGDVASRETSFSRLFPGRIVGTSQGDFYLCERRSQDVDLEYIDPAFADLFAQNVEGLSDELRPLLAGSVDKALLLDIETTGFSNCPLFLIGILFHSENQLRIEQLFARDYSEEVAVLTYLYEKIQEFDTLISFNGRSFDVPFIHNRMIYHRLPGTLDLSHLDLLHHARRKWKNSLPNCKLQTLEAHICQRPRIGDIPGSLIPDAYHEFVRTGNTFLLKEIFHHNMLDLLTMVELVVALIVLSP